MKKLWLAAGIALILGGCNPFEYHPYDTRLDKKYNNIYQKNIRTGMRIRSVLHLWEILSGGTMKRRISSRR